MSSLPVYQRVKGTAQLGVFKGEPGSWLEFSFAVCLRQITAGQLAGWTAQLCLPCLPTPPPSPELCRPFWVQEQVCCWCSGRSVWLGEWSHTVFLWAKS